MLRLLIVAVFAWLEPAPELATDTCDVTEVSGFDRNHDGRLDRIEERYRSRHCDEGVVPFA